MPKPEAPVAVGERPDNRLSHRFGANDRVALDETIRKAERLSRVEPRPPRLGAPVEVHAAVLLRCATDRGQAREVKTSVRCERGHQTIERLGPEPG